MNNFFSEWLIVSLLVLSGLVSCSHRADASILDCLKGELITREFAPSNREPKRFVYSSSCEPSDKYFRERDKKKLSSILLEFKIEAGTLIEPMDKGRPKKYDPVKAYLTLSSGSSPRMIEGYANAHRRKSVFFRDYLDYKIYKRKFKGVDFENVFHRENKEFFVSCNNSYCVMDGIDSKHRVYYELQIFDPSFRDWVLMHGLVTEFIEASYDHENHE